MPLRFVPLFFTLLLLGGCSVLSPFSSMTKLDLTLNSSYQLNPDLHGRPSPIVVRLYELKHPATFEGADFFSVYQRSKQVLSPDLIAQEELEIRPGETRKLRLSLQPGSRYVGVLAAYRDLSEAEWRYVIPIQEEKRNRLTLSLETLGLSVAEQEGRK